MQNTWQAQDFARVANTLAGVVDLKRVRNDAFRAAHGFRGLRRRCLRSRTLNESAEGLQSSCYGNVILQGSFRVAITGIRMPPLNFFVAGAILLKHPLENR